ncbi:MAG TPA: CAP domain-containing protein, partial [Propionibacteriaceae bacterium]|nr:CAP domain-containing protein [Propionibacteriaceae bacterium]
MCYREPKHRSTATPVKRSSKSKSARTAPTPVKRATLKTTETHSLKPTPVKRPTKAAKSTPAATASTSSAYATRSDWADAVLDELNAERARHGLAALKLNSELTSAAHAHNLAMAKANKLSHHLSGEAALGSRVSAACYRWSAVGE